MSPWSEAQEIRVFSARVKHNGIPHISPNPLNDDVQAFCPWCIWGAWFGGGNRPGAPTKTENRASAKAGLKVHVEGDEHQRVVRLARLGKKNEVEDSDD